MAIAEKAEGQVSDPQLVKRFVSPYVNRVTQQQLARIKRGGGNESEQGNSGDDGPVGSGPGGSDLQPGRIGDGHDGKGVSPGRSHRGTARGSSPDRGPARPTEAAKSPTVKRPTKQQVISGIATGDALLEIGKTGSPFENGIASLDEAAAIARAVGLASRILAMSLVRIDEIFYAWAMKEGFLGQANA